MHRTIERHHHGIERLYRSLDSDDTSTAVSVIVKVRGETCNVDCLYCYEKRKEAPGGARVNAAQIGRLATLFRGRPLAVEIHGGEPLTAGKEHIAEILRELSALPRVVRITLQTNGVLLDEGWLDLFEDLCPTLHVGVSLDGDAQGNTWRVGYDGRPIYPRIARALNLLSDRGRSVGVIAAVTPAVLGRAEAVLDHLAGFGSVNAVSFVPCFDTAIRRPTAATGRRAPASRLLQQAAMGSDGGPAWAIHPDEYAEFVLAATARWIRAGYFAHLKLEPAVSAIRRLRGLGTGFCHFSDLKCDHVLTLYPDGRLGSCDELPWPQAQLTLLDTTNDQHEVARAQRSSTLLNQGKALMQRCTTCDYRSTCGGGCVATHWRMNLVDGQDAYCDHRMRVIDGVAALLAQPAHPDGAWCRTLRWRPRSPNSMRDVAGFAARWDDRTPPHNTVRLRTSSQGNINTIGRPGVHEADDLDPLTLSGATLSNRGLVPGPHRDQPLEPHHVRQLRGHAYTDLELEPAVRKVGILARDQDEYADAASALCRAAVAAAAALPPAITVTLGRSMLTCETTGAVEPVLDLALQPGAGHSWDDYFAHLDDATVVLALALRDEHPSRGPACSCPVPAGRSACSPEETRS
ncbi:radical SAM protein [Kitasatospora aburaviensis]